MAIKRPKGKQGSVVQLESVFNNLLGVANVSGVVVSCGSRVTGWQAGDEVFGCPNLMGNGANAELVLLDARAAAHKR
jgi:NADPH:quinone reductase-like Zn-dependent oxidoreductase